MHSYINSCIEYKIDCILNKCVLARQLAVERDSKQYVKLSHLAGNFGAIVKLQASLTVQSKSFGLGVEFVFPSSQH